jgi:hypothetical protein
MIKLHAQKTQGEELAERERKNGMFLTTAEPLREKLEELNQQLSFARLKLSTSRKTAETASIIKSRGRRAAGASCDSARPKS